MLHAAVLEARYQRKAELGERVIDPGVFLQPVERSGVQFEDGIDVAGHLLGVGFTMQHGELAAADVAFNGLKFARDEGEQVGRYEICALEADLFSVAPIVNACLRRIRHGRPLGGDLKRQLVSCLEVRLVEEREGGSGAIRNEQRVKVFRVAVERGGAGDEFNFNNVLAGRETVRRQHDVLVAVFDGYGLTIGGDAVQMIGVLAEVEQQGLIVPGELEGKPDSSVDVFVGVHRHREPQGIVDV